jgi:hypothetical protein
MKSNENEYISYYNSFIFNLNKQELNRKKTIKEEHIQFVTCRYMDNSFKIHFVSKTNPKDIKTYSVICEDFVSSCCSLDHNRFFVGLKNGKLIQWSIIKEKKEIKFKLDKQIQAHKKTINVIEINKRLGIIITAGEDNYLFIRKIYDLELITPIKIKSKYIITMAKVSPINFLYIMCSHKTKNKKKSIIFGYSLCGLYFAKSQYNYYDSIDFTKNGNIVTYVNKKAIIILSGDKLIRTENNDDKEMNKLQNSISGASWINYSYFCRKYEIEPIINKVITFSIFDKERRKMVIKTIDVTNIKYFE